MAKNLIKTPAKPIPQKGKSPGIYDGEPGYPPRTKSSGPPEKTYDTFNGMKKG